MPPLDETPVADVLERHEKKTWLGLLLRPKVAIPLTLLVLLFLAPFVIRGYFLGGVPDVEEPFDSAALISDLVPDAENAFTHYQKAAALKISPSQEVSDTRDLVNIHGWAMATPELAQFLHDNEVALIEWKAGAALERSQSTPPSEYSFASPLLSIQEIQKFYRTGIALTHQLEADGDPQAAWSWINSLLRTSRHLGRQGSLIERLVGVAIASAVLERLQTWAANPLLTADDLRRALQEYEAMLMLTPTNSELFQIEYLMIRQTLELLESGELDWNDFDVSHSHPFMHYIRGEPELTLRLTRIYFRNQLPFVDLPPHARPSLAGRYALFDDPATMTFEGQVFDARDFEAAAKKSLLYHPFATSTQQAVIAMDRDLVVMRCGRVLLASQVYFRERGSFPIDLAELVPDYLSEVPADPYSGKPLLLSADPTEPAVYSVYLNKTDEGGIEYSWAQSVRKRKGHPDDFGLKLITPGSIPLVAPKPIATTPEEH